MKIAIICVGVVTLRFRTVPPHGSFNKTRVNRAMPHHGNVIHNKQTQHYVTMWLVSSLKDLYCLLRYTRSRADNIETLLLFAVIDLRNASVC